MCIKKIVAGLFHPEIIMKGLYKTKPLMGSFYVQSMEIVRTSNNDPQPRPICWSKHVPGLNGNEGGRMGGLTFTFSGHFIWERVIKFITNVLFSLS